MALLVNDTTPRVQYTATSGQTTFAYPFAIFEDSDLKVYQVSSSGTPDDDSDILTLTTHYTVTGAGTTSGGNVVLVTGATAGDIITIKRDLAIKRTTDYQNLGDLASTSFNDDLDKLVMMVQQNEEGLNRALTLANSSQVNGNFDVDDPVAGYFARAKSDLSGIEWLDTQSVGQLSVSAYMQTLLDDATSLAARDTLGVIEEGIYRGIAAGTADALTVSLSPTMTALTDGQVIFVRALLANATATPTINVDSLGAKTIVKEGGQALVAGDIARAGHDLILKYNAANTEWELLNPSNLERSMQSITGTVADSALTVGLNPTRLSFRDSTLTDGAPTVVNISSAISLTIPSGATLGTIDTIQSRLILVVINNAGTAELAIVNLAGGNDLSETGVISTTAISAAADSDNVFYSTSARSNVAYRVVGFVESTQATAGTWATSPSLIQGAGGNALTAMSSPGYGQVWQDFTGSRSLSTTYYNTTGKPITVRMQLIAGTGASYHNTVVTIGGVALPAVYASGDSIRGLFDTFLVPARMSYSVVSTPDAGTSTIRSWSELR